MSTLDAITNPVKKIVLASSSPRRQAFLRDLGLAFAVIPADIDETPLPSESPLDLVTRLASSKARSVALRLPATEQAVVIAADTVVALGQTSLNKPVDKPDAVRMLTELRNVVHEVHSAVSIVDTTTGYAETVVNSTHVWMRNYSDAEIDRYVDSGDPMDKAGAYAIQHPGFNPAQEIQGCLSGVMGLPLGDLQELLTRMGVEMPKNVVAVCETQTHFGCCQRTRSSLVVSDNVDR
jgi:MAF protein